MTTMPAIGSRVAIVDHRPGPSPHMRDLRGRAGTVTCVHGTGFVQLTVEIDGDMSRTGQRALAVFAGEWRVLR